MTGVAWCWSATSVPITQNSDKPMASNASTELLHRISGPRSTNAVRPDSVTATMTRQS